MDSSAVVILDSDSDEEKPIQNVGMDKKKSEMVDLTDTTNEGLGPPRSLPSCKNAAMDIGWSSDVAMLGDGNHDGDAAAYYGGDDDGALLLSESSSSSSSGSSLMFLEESSPLQDGGALGLSGLHAAGSGASFAGGGLSNGTALTNLTSKACRGVSAVDLTEEELKIISCVEQPSTSASALASLRNSPPATLSPSPPALRPLKRNRHLTAPSVRCKACRASVVEHDSFCVHLCSHSVCVACLRRHVEARLQQANNMKTQKIKWSGSSSVTATSPQKPIISSLVTRSSPVLRQRSSPGGRGGAAATARRVSLSEALEVSDTECLSSVPASCMLLPPVECPVKDCPVPLSWTAVEDLVGKAAWQSFATGCLKRFEEVTSLSEQPRDVWVACPGCQCPLKTFAKVVKLPNGDDVSRLTAVEMRTELAARGLVKAGQRPALIDRLTEALKREQTMLSYDCPPLLHCTNRWCMNAACTMCGQVSMAATGAVELSAPKSRGSTSKSRAAPAQEHQRHFDCMCAPIFRAVTLCRHLNSVLHVDRSAEVSAKKKKKPSTSASSSGGIGYSGGQSEKAGISSREAEQAQQREVEFDNQYMKIIEGLNQQLQKLSDNIREHQRSQAASTLVSLCPTVDPEEVSESPAPHTPRGVTATSSAEASADSCMEVFAVGSAQGGGDVAACSAGTESNMDVSSPLTAAARASSSGDGITAACAPVCAASSTPPGDGDCAGRSAQVACWSHPLLWAAIHRDLLPALHFYLHNDSISDVAQRRGVYMEVFSLLTTMLKDPNLLSLLSEPVVDGDGDSRGSVAAQLDFLHTQAKVFLSAGDQTSSSDAELSSTIAVAKTVRETYSEIQVELKESNMSRSIQVSRLRKREIINLSSEDENSPSPRPKRKRASLDSNVAGSGVSLEDVFRKKETEKFAKLEAEYVETLMKLRFDSAPVLTDSHCFNATAVGTKDGSTLPQKRLLRISQEIASLSTSLPVTYNSSIFLRVDTVRPDVLKALVIGPEDTPYANGLFEFDLFLPCRYPAVPPLCRLVTTNYGKVRFNPNLYADGKVCLSLLGTWSGPSWDPKNSTLLQVLISIQGMILVPDPYFNEPGFEQSRKTDSGKWSSDNYNARIRESTVRFAMVKQLTSPHPLFAKVIREHFRLKGDAIMKQLEGWIDSATLATPKPPRAIICDGGIPTSSDTMRKAVQDLKAQLDLLQPIEL